MSIYYFPPTNHLSQSAETLLRTVIEEGPYDDDLMDPDIFWWIAELLERRGAMAEDLIPGMDSKAVMRKASRLSFATNTPKYLVVETLVEKAVALALTRGKDEATDRDVIQAVLSYWDDSYHQVPTGPLMASEAPEPIFNPNAEHATGNKATADAPQDNGHKTHKKTDQGFNIHGPFNDQSKKT